MLFQLECAEESVAKPHLLTSRPSSGPGHRQAEQRGPLAGTPLNTELGASLQPGARGGTFLAHVPSQRHLCGVGQDTAYSFYLSRGSAACP